jgi:tRNA modification GTPase
VHNLLKNYNTNDTIAAIATFPGSSALGVIKISGSNAVTILSKVFKPHKNKDIKKAKTFTLHYGTVVDKKGDPVDEVIVALMLKPKSYTCEDVVEISSHGGVLMVNRILNLVLASGVRLALPGEFTYRAFLNGRVSLAQAQAVNDIVQARSEAGIDLAFRQLRGEHFERLEKTKNSLKELFAQTEACLNFPEEDISFSLSDITKKINFLTNNLERLLKGAQEARIIKEGLRCVIAGRANAGKSTLFNCLLRQERVLVSHIAGTTRDVIEEAITVGGVALRIFDTAGIIDSKDFLTQSAVKRSREAIQGADIVLFVVDGTCKFSSEDKKIVDLLKDKVVISVVNKSDLPQKIITRMLPGRVVKISALKSKGIGNLEKAVHSFVYAKGINRHDLVFLSRYQEIKLQEVLMYLRQAQDFLRKEHSFDMANAALRSALESFGRLTGEVECEEILSDIFGKFCIGK